MGHRIRGRTVENSVVLELEIIVFPEQRYHLVRIVVCAQPRLRRVQIVLQNPTDE